jgi:hypothetical protein
MCSIEEAWAGQTFEGRKVQSQAELHRKYMPISDNLLERNNEFSIGRNEPQSREGTRGINTKQLHQSSYSNPMSRDYSGNMQVQFANNEPIASNYGRCNTPNFSAQRVVGGVAPRPSYMSIYDNANMPMPMPSTTTMGGKDNFNDINQAFTVSKTVDRFMNQNREYENNNVNDVNVLLNEDNDIDRKILQKKFIGLNNNEQFNNTQNINTQNIQFQKTLQDILQRLDYLETKMKNNNTRNMYDMVLYILVGMLISFIIYAILRK